MTIVRTQADLQAIYGNCSEASLIKEIDFLSPGYQAFVTHSPFVILSTVGPEGTDASPRGDKAGFVRIETPRTLLLPDRRGNNRIDSLRNIVRDPRCSMMFMVPGNANVLRVNGHAEIDVDDALCKSFEVEGKAPRSVIRLHVQKAYFQCARAIMRADLWGTHRVPELPTPGQMMKEITAGGFDGDTYDKEWPGRAQKSLW
ncbi:pyridoxamine 5'-phosphate oxidase family protein [Maritalea mediterranea]|uniref:Pyridoxamine 5'-phosphate oxidase family protein n=1 Tax=Maritalea mediterranea TaxID=2909667 RepID=A0ABS9E5R3_9HYPH|nr:pyridoxamine 5'-phosphate oxidase family protein [Maritalea mediterranea]MCF4097552.1 pyridoxamine 5'-phosphate oxidase family protein [Maritalea mediterranea]